MSDIVERLKSSGVAFRKYDVYTADGDAVRLNVQALEMQEAAAEITRLRALAAANKKEGQSVELHLLDTNERLRAEVERLKSDVSELMQINADLSSAEARATEAERQRDVLVGALEKIDDLPMTRSPGANGSYAKGRDNGFNDGVQAAKVIARQALASLHTEGRGDG